MSKVSAWFIGAAAIAMLVVVVALSITERVQDGHVAVVYTPSAGAKEVLDPGFHMVGLLDKTYEFSVRQEVIDTSVEVNTSDGKKVTIPVTYNMRIESNADTVLALFKAYGARGESYYSETVVQQQLRRLAKETVVQYTTLEMFTDKLTEAGNSVSERIAKAMEADGIVITDLAFLSPEIDANTQAAIDAQIQAQQTNELKKLELENEKIEAAKNKVIEEGKAAQKLVQAEADAKSKRMAADAQAYANNVMAKSLTENILKKMELEARAKHGWVEIQGASTVVTDKQ